ncbi:MAG: DUF1800 domain-containing protein [Rhodoferax sp.]
MGGPAPTPLRVPEWAAAAAMVTACAQTPTDTRRTDAHPRSADDAARLLLQAQFSASPAEITQVLQLGYAPWLETQLQRQPSADALAWLESRGYGQADAQTRYFDHSYPADYALWRHLMTADDPVRQRMALALSEYFVVSAQGLDMPWRSHALVHYWDMLCQHAFGNFLDLLKAVTLHPAMGQYLATRGNQQENPATGRQPDENYAREVMQLFTIGLYQLHADGSAKHDALGKRIETYDQSDIVHLARVFTGYDFDQSANVVTELAGPKPRKVGNALYTQRPMAFLPARHSSLEVRFLGQRIAAGTPGPQALEQALDVLFHHPNVGPFFGRQMIQRLVTSNPSPAYVARVTNAFNNNGQGVRGDLRAVWRAILLDEEARSPATLTQSDFGKIREPMLRFIQWGRTFRLRSAEGSWKIGDLSNPATQLGQSPLRSPSVFNYFRPGYVPPSTVLAQRGATAPEFQMVHETSVAGYVNFMQGVIRRGLYVADPERPDSAPGPQHPKAGFDLQADYTRELELAEHVPALLGHLNLLLCAGQLSVPTLALMAQALQATPLPKTANAEARLNRVAGAVLMVMTAPEYLIQK